MQEELTSHWMMAIDNTMYWSVSFKSRSEALRAALRLEQQYRGRMEIIPDPENQGLYRLINRWIDHDEYQHDRMCECYHCFPF